MRGGTGRRDVDGGGPAPQRLDAGLVEEVRGHLSRHGGEVGPDLVAGVARGRGTVLGGAALAGVTEAIRAEVSGAGPLQPYLDDPQVTDVLVNSAEDVWVDRGDGLRRVPVRFSGSQEVRRLAVRLAAAGGQRLDDASPLVDARLPDGTRLHAVLPPVCAEGALISLRTARPTAFTLEQLAAAGSLPGAWCAVLRTLVERRANLLISGATGTGKTTLLAALLSLVPPHERILVVEEAAELMPDHPHVVGLSARRANVEGAGAVGLPELVRNALRMRPDRLVLGECRGAEVREVLMALTTGHDGGCATVHANAAADVPARLEALASLAGLSGEAVAAQAVSAFHVVVHLRRRGGRRFVEEIAVTGRQGGGGLGGRGHGLGERARDRLVVTPALRWDGDREPSTGPGLGELLTRWGIPGGAPEGV